MLKNLFSNAVDHADEGGVIHCRLQTSSPEFQLQITNTQTSLTEQDLPHIFEPFWSKDASRSDSRHCGLGLSLLKVYAETLNLRLDVNLLQPDKIRFSIQSK